MDDEENDSDEDYDSPDTEDYSIEEESYDYFFNPLEVEYNSDNDFDHFAEIDHREDEVSTGIFSCSFFVKNDKELFYFEKSVNLNHVIPKNREILKIKILPKINIDDPDCFVVVLIELKKVKLNDEIESQKCIVFKSYVMKVDPKIKHLKGFKCSEDGYCLYHFNGRMDMWANLNKDRKNIIFLFYKCVKILTIKVKPEIIFISKRDDGFLKIGYTEINSSYSPSLEWTKSGKTFNYYFEGKLLFRKKIEKGEKIIEVSEKNLCEIPYMINNELLIEILYKFKHPLNIMKLITQRSYYHPNNHAKFTLEYQKFVYFILWLSDQTESDFSKISRDVLVYNIIPYVGQRSLYIQIYEKEITDFFILMASSSKSKLTKFEKRYSLSLSNISDNNLFGTSVVFSHLRESYKKDIFSKNPVVIMIGLKCFTKLKQLKNKVNQSKIQKEIEKGKKEEENNQRILTKCLLILNSNNQKNSQNKLSLVDEKTVKYSIKIIEHFTRIGMYVSEVENANLLNSLILLVPSTKKVEGHVFSLIDLIFEVPRPNITGSVFFGKLLDIIKSKNKIRCMTFCWAIKLIHRLVELRVHLEEKFVSGLLKTFIKNQDFFLSVDAFSNIIQISGVFDNKNDFDVIIIGIIIGIFSNQRNIYFKLFKELSMENFFVEASLQFVKSQSISQVLGDEKKGVAGFINSNTFLIEGILSHIQLVIHNYDFNLLKIIYILLNIIQFPQIKKKIETEIIFECIRLLYVRTNKEILIQNYLEFISIIRVFKEDVVTFMESKLSPEHAVEKNRVVIISQFLKFCKENQVDLTKVSFLREIIFPLGIIEPIWDTSIDIIFENGIFLKEITKLRKLLKECDLMSNELGFGNVQKISLNVEIIEYICECDFQDLSNPEKNLSLISPNKTQIEILCGILFFAVEKNFSKVNFSQIIEKLNTVFKIKFKYRKFICLYIFEIMSLCSFSVDLGLGGGDTICILNLNDFGTFLGSLEEIDVKILMEDDFMPKFKAAFMNIIEKCILSVSFVSVCLKFLKPFNEKYSHFFYKIIHLLITRSKFKISNLLSDLEPIICMLLEFFEKFSPNKGRKLNIIRDQNVFYGAKILLKVSQNEELKFLLEKGSLYQTCIDFCKRKKFRELSLKFAEILKNIIYFKKARHDLFLSRIEKIYFDDVEISETQTDEWRKFCLVILEILEISLNKNSNYVGSFELIKKIFRVIISLEYQANLFLLKQEKLMDLSKKLFVQLVVKSKSNNDMSTIIKYVDLIVAKRGIGVENLETCIDLLNRIIKFLDVGEKNEKRIELVKAEKQRLLEKKKTVSKVKLPWYVKNNYYFGEKFQMKASKIAPSRSSQKKNKNKGEEDKKELVQFNFDFGSKDDNKKKEDKGDLFGFSFEKENENDLDNNKKKEQDLENWDFLRSPFEIKENDLGKKNEKKEDEIFVFK